MLSCPRLRKRLLKASNSHHDLSAVPEKINQSLQNSTQEDIMYLLMAKCMNGSIGTKEEKTKLIQIPYQL
jgi:hypothetical protein